MSADYVTDPTCVPDTFCEGLSTIKRMGDNFRLTAFATRGRGDGDVEKLVVSQQVWSREDLARANRQIQAALDGVPYLDESRPQAPMLLS